MTPERLKIAVSRLERRAASARFSKVAEELSKLLTYAGFAKSDPSDEPLPPPVESAAQKLWRALLDTGEQCSADTLRLSAFAYYSMFVAADAARTPPELTEMVRGHCALVQKHCLRFLGAVTVAPTALPAPEKSAPPQRGAHLRLVKQ